MANSRFKDLDAFLDDTLALPVAGKVYTIRPVSGAFGLRLERMMAEGEAAAHGEADEDAIREAFDGMDDEVFNRELLGDVYRELLDDGVPYRTLKIVSSTAMIWNLSGEDAAVEFWNAGGKAPEPNRRQRRAGTTRTGAASTTKRPASGTGTSTRPRKNAGGRKAEA